MRLLTRLLARCGVPAFFFFSWILELLWNSILFDQLRLVPTKLSYWQSAGLWFAAIIAFAWVGLGLRSARALRRPRRRPDDELERREEAHSSSRDCGDLAERIERDIRRGFARWVDADEGTEWDTLAELIERKVKRAFRTWID